MAGALENIAVPLYPFFTALKKCSWYCGKSISTCPRSALVSCRQSTSGSCSAMNFCKAPFASTARIPFTFQEYNFMYILYQMKEGRPSTLCNRAGGTTPADHILSTSASQVRRGIARCTCAAQPCPASWRHRTRAWFRAGWSWGRSTCRC